ncbi:uncharacterized protein BO97DRAFT_417145 [Aspergillus homomorphus CBS 101889]|uniref:Uncharacterized protein n=1 Tax=Aspergillus homomorphus (strain CBS 101889) TaxID=1450537 RepID=A0A395HMA5_ASPHC|nr:hypothetical protein BO97DRAFT_417145 [Aspergillus homomorphus CBS 101889]RAL09072.1 hypothetical protein BO97DRAFT_417145 [Aspergillus homomorphus CBS 101889]
MAILRYLSLLAFSPTLHWFTRGLAQEEGLATNLLKCLRESDQGMDYFSPRGARVTRHTCPVTDAQCALWLAHDAPKPRHIARHLRRAQVFSEGEGRRPLRPARSEPPAVRTAKQPLKSSECDMVPSVAKTSH